MVFHHSSRNPSKDRPKEQYRLYHVVFLKSKMQEGPVFLLEQCSCPISHGSGSLGHIKAILEAGDQNQV